MCDAIYGIAQKIYAERFEFNSPALIYYYTGCEFLVRFGTNSSYTYLLYLTSLEICDRAQNYLTQIFGFTFIIIQFKI